MDISVAQAAATLPPSAKAVIGRVQGGAASTSESKARAAAQEFEGMFLTQMLELMFSGLNTDPPFGGGQSETVFRSMLVGEYAKDLAKNGGIGLADAVYREILAVQEKG